MGRFVSGTFFLWDVLSLGTFCPLGRIVFGTYCLWDVLSLGHFVPGTFCPLGRFVPWDVLSLGTFCLGTFCLGTFVCAPVPVLVQCTWVKVPVLVLVYGFKLDTEIQFPTQLDFTQIISNDTHTPVLIAHVVGAAVATAAVVCGRYPESLLFLPLLRRVRGL